MFSCIEFIDFGDTKKSKKKDVEADTEKTINENP